MPTFQGERSVNAVSGAASAPAAAIAGQGRWPHQLKPKADAVAAIALGAVGGGIGESDQFDRLPPRPRALRTAPDADGDLAMGRKGVRQCQPCDKLADRLAELLRPTIGLS